MSDSSLRIPVALTTLALSLPVASAVPNLSRSRAVLHPVRVTTTSSEPISASCSSLTLARSCVAARAVGGYVATGHGEHGVLTALSGGLALAQLILDGKPLPSHSVDVTPFSTLRFG